MMLSRPFRRLTWASALCATLASSVCAAQMIQAIPGNAGSAAVDTLSMHLRTLATSPRDLKALLGAGGAALEVGDPNAALGFFARADEIDGRSGSAKAGLASALVLLEKPDDALRLFGEAAALGTADTELAAYRGLAYDLRGDNRRAQRDYVLALKARPDDEVTRRYALSLGISGDRAEALALLDPLLRRQDQAAWRARSFILAMTGDVAGANSAARQAMPVGLANSMAPFLNRLATLNGSERAHAVNFGTVPSEGQTFVSVQRDVVANLPVAQAATASAGLIPAGRPLGPNRVSVPHSASARPQPPVTTRIGTRIAPVDRSRLPPEARGESVIVRRVVTGVLPPPGAAAAVVQSPAAVRAPTPTTQPPPVPGMARNPVIGPPADPSTTPAFEVASRAVAVEPRPPAIVSRPGPAPNRLASLLSGIAPEEESRPVALPTANEQRIAQRAAAAKASAEAVAAAAVKRDRDAKDKLLAAARAHPARIWVQVATGNNARGLATTWNRIRSANAALLDRFSGYSVPFKATNRVLAGPVKSTAEARTLVNALAKAQVSATTYSSEAGQEISKLATR